MRIIFTLLFLFTGLAPSLAQKHPIISGKVTDAETQKPLDYVTVHAYLAKVPVFTDEQGKYELVKYALHDSVTFLLLGYEPLTQTISALQKSGNIALKRQSYAIQEIVVRPRENPAFKIIRAAALNKEQFLPKNQPSIQFDTYTLLKASILERDISDKKKGFSKRYAPFLDSLVLNNGSKRTASLPIFQSETVKETYFTNNPDRTKEVLKASQITGVGIEKEAQMAQLLNAQAEHFSLNQNYLRMFDKDFVSPISDQWSAYYDYDLLDSVETASGKVYKLNILPKRPQDLTFSGLMWIADGTFSLRRVELIMNPQVRLNFISDLQIVQSWDNNKPTLLPLSSKRKFQISGLPGTDVRLFVETITTYTDLVLGEPKPDAFYTQSYAIADSALEYSASYWQEIRPTEFSPAEVKRIENIQKINKLPEIQSAVKLIRVFVEGHLPLNDKFEWGPVFGTYVYNNVEGHRFQFGGRTTEFFHPNWILNGYAAYGTRDKNFKSLLNVRYVANRQQWTEWGGSYLKDVGPAAMDLNNSQVSSIFFSAFRWGSLNFPYQQERVQLWAEREWFPAFRQRFTLRHANYIPAFEIAKPRDNEPQNKFSAFRSTDVTLNITYSPDRKTLIRHHEKIAISNSNSPVFGLEVSAGIKGLLNSDLSYQQVTLSLDQRVRAGVFGYGRYYFRAGKTFSKVPLSLLQVPVGNETPFFILHGYNLMPFFAFATDEFVSLRYDHHFEGAFSLTNRLPLLKKTRVRLVAGGAVLYGQLTEKNQEFNITGAEDNEFQGLGNTPYAEVNVGLKNIFQILRVDLVHRLTYKDLTTSNWGVRLSVSVNP